LLNSSLTFARFPVSLAKGRSTKRIRKPSRTRVLPGARNPKLARRESHEGDKSKKIKSTAAVNLFGRTHFKWKRGG